jgi:hypothetical protein
VTYRDGPKRCSAPRRSTCSEPSKLPAQLYDLLARTTDDSNRRLAAALARCWAYAGHAGRAVLFSDEAVNRSSLVGDPELIAHVDNGVLVRWKIVPAVTDVCRPQVVHIQRDLAVRQPPSLSQAGQTNPFGHRSRSRYARHDASSGNHASTS